MDFWFCYWKWLGIRYHISSLRVQGYGTISLASEIRGTVPYPFLVRHAGGTVPYPFLVRHAGGTVNSIRKQVMSKYNDFIVLLLFKIVQLNYLFDAICKSRTTLTIIACTKGILLL